MRFAVQTLPAVMRHLKLARDITAELTNRPSAMLDEKPAQQ